MEDTANRSSVASLRSQFSSRVVPSEDRAATSDELVNDDSAPSRRRKSADVNTANQFSGSLVPAQFKIPSDLLQSLKLHAINSNETMSEIVLRCLTTSDLIEKAWISTRKAS